MSKRGQIEIKCVSIKGACEITNRHESTIYRYVKAGQIQSLKYFNRVFIPLFDLADFLGITLYDAEKIVKEKAIHTVNLWVRHTYSEPLRTQGIWGLDPQFNTAFRRSFNGGTS